MTEGMSSSGNAAAGWYPDVHEPGRMRYFDGTSWTNHFHTPGQFPPVGEWIQGSFDVARRVGLGLLVLFFVSGLLVNAIVLSFAAWALHDLGVVGDQIVGFEPGRVGIAAVVTIVLSVLASLPWLMASSHFHKGHYQREATLQASFRDGLRALPRFVGNYLLVVAGFALATGLVFGVAALVSPLLMVPLLPLLFGLLLFGFVKVGFLNVSAVLAPRGTSALKASAECSDGRFWQTLGRFLLAAVIAIAVGMVGQILTVPFQGAVAEPPQPGSTEFYFRDLFPAFGVGVVAALIVTQAVGAITNTLLCSMWVRLYLDAGGSRDAQ